jgi:hypothetical protein
LIDSEVKRIERNRKEEEDREEMRGLKKGKEKERTGPERSKSKAGDRRQKI